MDNAIVGKLAVNSYAERLILNKPDNIDCFDSIPHSTSIDRGSYDFIMVFIFSLDEFAQFIKTVSDKKLLNPDGFLYFVYPKKGNKEYSTYIGRDEFFETPSIDKDGYIKGSQIKFAKMLSFSDTFTLIGLKHYTKRINRDSKPSQCVADYLSYIPLLQKHFSNNTEVLNLYNQLTPGYQRGWARYVYSAQTEQTRNKRLGEMAKILKEGCKSIDHVNQ